jgi:ketosteroid isomerase-like protein
MSQGRVEVVRRLFAYWERGDWPASAELFDPDFETVFGTESFPIPATIGEPAGPSMRGAAGWRLGTSYVWNCRT